MEMLKAYRVWIRLDGKVQSIKVLAKSKSTARKAIKESLPSAVIGTVIKR